MPKPQKSKMTRAESNAEIKQWLKEQGTTESVKFDEETGERHQVFTLDLTKTQG